MKTSSAKAKGRNLQKYVVQAILELFPKLEPDDVCSRAMGSQGEDVMLSPRARNLLPISIECKSHAKYAVYKDYQQAVTNAKGYDPVLIIKQNNSHPLAVVHIEFLLELIASKLALMEKLNDKNKETKNTKETQPYSEISS